MTTINCWAWKNPDETIQEDTFQSADAALLCMKNRINKDSYEEMKELGFHLCRVRVTMEVISCLK